MKADESAAALLNPFYATTLQDRLFIEHRSKTAKEDWVVVNAHLMEDTGARAWLDEFLDVVSLPRSEYDGHDAIDPGVALKVSDRLRGDHEPLVTREQWISANEKLIKEIGAAEWLSLLLDVLETGGPIQAN